MLRSAPTLFLAALSFVSSAPARGAETRAASEPAPAASRVTAVVIHRQHALVTREAEVVLAEGEKRILIGPLPASLDPSSVRVGGTGSQPVTVRGVEVRLVHEEPPPSPETGILEAEMKDVTHQQGLATERRRTIESLRGFLQGLKAAAEETSSRDLVTRGFPTADWGHAYDFLSTHFDRLAAEERSIIRDDDERTRRLDTLGARLAETAAKRAPDHYTAEVTVSAPQPGKIRLALKYLVSGASWTPLYDARLHPAAGRITIDWLGQIRQTTGEDWDDVAVTLTTAQAVIGIDLPRLASMRLVDRRRAMQGGFVEVVDGMATTEAGIGTEFIDALPILGRNYQDVLRLAPGTNGTEGDGSARIHGARDVDVRRVGRESVRVTPMRPPEPAIEVALSQVVAGGADRVLSYEIPGRLSIPSDGQGHQHLITSRDTVALIEYHCVPALSRDVYLVARWTLPADVTLLPGSMAHFVEGDLVGRSEVAPRAGGEELTLSFGPEGRLRADRRDTLLRTARRGRDEERDRTVVTTLENHLGRAVVVKLSDRIPTSGDDRIDVTMNQDDTTTPLPADPLRPGILRWDVALADAGKTDVTLRYRIRAPIGMLPVEP